MRPNRANATLAEIHECAVSNFMIIVEKTTKIMFPSRNKQIKLCPTNTDNIEVSLALFLNSLGVYFTETMTLDGTVILVSR